MEDKTYLCGSFNKTILDGTTGGLKAISLRCGNIRRCEYCRSVVVKKLIRKMSANTVDNWYIGYSDTGKSFDISRSITRCGGLYIRIPQKTNTAFITDTPRRLNSVVVLRTDAASIKEFLDKLIMSMPDGSRSTDNFPEENMERPTKSPPTTRIHAQREVRVVQDGCEIDIDKENWRVKSNNMRALVRGQVADLSLDQWMGILDRFSKRCAYCGNPFQELDHITAITDGGGTTQYNVVPSCKKCNRDKNYSNRRLSHNNGDYYVK